MISRLFSFMLLGGGLLAQSIFGQSPYDADPSKQVEKDWVDSRWNQTDLGQFLASNLDLPGARIAKGLSIKIGDKDEGAVCYDTAHCTWRGLWLGGFLKFDPARYGLISGPKINGDILVTAPNGFGWKEPNLHYAGLRLHGKRVVLDYRSEGFRVSESPWLEGNVLPILTRSFEVAGHNGPAALELLPAAGEVDIHSNEGTIEKNGQVIAVRLIGDGAALSRSGEKLLLTFPASSENVGVRLAIWKGAKRDLSKFREIAGQLKTETVEDLTKPGPPRWLPELATKGQRAFDSDFLAVDTLTVPYDNPWKALMFLAGVDFTSDGAAYVCSIHGDVWRVTGIDAGLQNLRWNRFATGLFQPLGLKVRGDQIYVLGRDQITCLHDLNQDGEADFYEDFCNLMETSPGHNYVTSLETDDAGNFYYVDPLGVHRITPDGQKKQTLATGFRNPNGLGVSPDGKIVTVAPQQGEWTPSSEICEIKPGGYYGYGGPRKNPERLLGYDDPLCWIPHSVDNSSGSQVWVPEGQWGPLGGQMLHLLWGRCQMALILRDAHAGVSQGALVPLPGRFLSGPQRATFNKKEGALYVAGSTGWQTSAPKEGALQRVRYTARPAVFPVAWHATKDGISLTFSQPLDPTTAADPGSYALHAWNYRYAAQYGSRDWSLKNPDKEGHDDLEIKSVRVQPDNKTVFLAVPELRPVMQMELAYNVNATSGRPVKSKMWLTVNTLGE